MNSAVIFSRCHQVIRNLTCQFRTTSMPLLQEIRILDPPDELILEGNNYRERQGESLEKKKLRLMYQSRKRGMLENDLLLSTFAAKYLPKMTEHEVNEYDKLINFPSNEWDLFNWALGSKQVPSEFDNSVMKLLQHHTKNTEKEKRYRQPDLFA